MTEGRTAENDAPCEQCGRSGRHARFCEQRRVEELLRDAGVGQIVSTDEHGGWDVRDVPTEVIAAVVRAIPPVPCGSLAERIRSEANIADRPGQYDRLNQIAAEVERIQRDAWAEGLLHGRHFPWAKPGDSPYQACVIPPGTTNGGAA